MVTISYGMLLIVILCHFDAPLHHLAPISPSAITKGSVKLIKLYLQLAIDVPPVPPPEPQPRQPSSPTPPSPYPVLQYVFLKAL